MKRSEEILLQDSEYIFSNYDFSELKASVIFITGATGLIGKNLVSYIDYLNSNHGYDIHLILLSRDEAKARRTFAFLKNTEYKIITGNISSTDFSDLHFDYLIHGAAVTASAQICSSPVELITDTVAGTSRVLSQAVKSSCRSAVYLSSMEAYGTVENSKAPLKEENLGYINLTSPRSSYSESKRMCECLCSSFFSEYGLNVKSLRLAQTLGPLADDSDRRLPSYLALCAAQGQDIILNTPALSKRNLLYTRDAVSAVFTVLLKGKGGEIYNAASPETYSSVRENAGLVCSIMNSKIKLMFSMKEGTPFPPPTDLNLDISRIQALGWKPSVGLRQAFENLIECTAESLHSGNIGADK